MAPIAITYSLVEAAWSLRCTCKLAGGAWRPYCSWNLAGLAWHCVVHICRKFGESILVPLFYLESGRSSLALCCMYLKFWRGHLCTSVLPGTWQELPGATCQELLVAPLLHLVWKEQLRRAFSTRPGIYCEQPGVPGILVRTVLCTCCVFLECGISSLASLLNFCYVRNSHLPLHMVPGIWQVPHSVPVVYISNLREQLCAPFLPWILAGAAWCSWSRIWQQQLRVALYLKTGAAWYPYCI